MNTMNNSEEEIFIDLSLFGSSNIPNHRIIYFFLVSLVLVGFVIFFTTLFYRPDLFGNGIFFLLFIFISSTVLWYQARRWIIRLQISRSGVVIQTFIKTHHYSASEIDDLLLKHLFSWPVLAVRKVSTKRNVNYFISYYNVGKMSPMSLESTIRDAIVKYKNYFHTGA
jgi:hypothetical protein